MRGVAVDVVANTERARVQVGAFAQQMEKRLDAATRSLGDIRIDGDAGPVERKIWMVRQQLATLSSQRVGIDVDADTASRRIDAIHAELTRLARLSPNIQVKVDTAAALAQLAALRAGFEDTGRVARAQVSALSSHMSRHAQLMQAAISAGMLAISAAVGPALAVIGMIPAAVLGVIAPVGALAVGFSGVGDAIDAMAAAQEAATGTAAEQAAANEKLAAAMAKLTPEAQEFVRTWTSELIPAMRTVRAMVASELFPGLEQSLHNIQPLIPIIADGLADTAAIIGELSAKGTAMMASGPWRNDFAQIMESNNRAFRSWGEAGLSVLDMLRNLMAATGPITERFASFAQQASATFAAFIEGKRASGELGLFFQQMGDALAQLGSVLGQTASGLYDFATAIAPMGMLFLQAVAGLVELIGNLAQANPLLAQVAVVALGLAPAFRFAATAATALGTAFTFLIGGGLATKLSAAAVSAGALTTSFMGSAAAGEKAAAASSKVGTAVAAVGRAIPALTVAVVALGFAYEAQRSKAEAWAASIMKGGQDATNAIREITAAEQEAEAHSFGNWIGVLSEKLGVATPRMTEVTAKIKEMEGAMDPLALATSRAQQAQNDYLNVLNKTPGDTAAVTSAYERWITATEEEKRQQEALEQALSKTTEGIKKQQDAIIGSIDAEVNYRNSLDDLTESVKENGTAADMLSQKGRDNITAFSDLVKAARTLDDKLIESKTPPAELAKAHQDHVAALRDAAAKMGLHGPVIDALIQAYADAKPPVDGLSGAVAGMPQPKDLNFRADAGQAVGVVEGLGATIRAVLTPQEMQLAIDAGLVPATIAGVGASLNALPNPTQLGISANAGQAVGVIEGVGTAIRSVLTPHEVQLAVDAGLVPATIAGVNSSLNAIPNPTEVVISGDPAPAITAAGQADTSVRSVLPEWLTTFLGWTAPLLADIGFANAGIGTVPGQHPTAFTGDTGNILAQAGAATGAINGVPPDHNTPITGDATSAVGEAGRAGQAINGIPRPAPVRIDAQDNASGVIERVSRLLDGINGRTVRTFIETVQKFIPGVAAGGILAPMATGGVLPMAQGDALLDRARPMSGRAARIVPPNTPRLIGDRMRDDEAFVPINNSPWSQAVLGQAANRMGFALAPLTPMAHGGINIRDLRDEKAWEWIAQLLQSLRGRPRGGGGFPGAPGRGLTQPGTPGPAPTGRAMERTLTSRFQVAGGVASMTRANPLYSPTPWRWTPPDPRGGGGPIQVEFGRTGSRLFDEFLGEVAEKLRGRGGDSQVFFGRR